MGLRSVAASLFRVFPGPVRRALAVEPPPTHLRPYTFTSDWFSHKIPHWEVLLRPFRGRPGVRYLEIGVFEGRSLLWVLDHVLTDPSSAATAVDLFPTDYRQRLQDNLAISGAADRVRVIEGPGEMVMKDLDNESYDIVYLDGGHAAWTVFQQAALGWLLLKAGGVLIFDDYRWCQGELPRDLRPELPIDAFVASFAQQLDVLHVGDDVIVRKKARSCEEYYCTAVTARLVYVWRRRALLSRDGNREIPLTEGQKSALEKILLAPPPFQFQDVIGDPAFKGLVDLLQEEG